MKKALKSTWKQFTKEEAQSMLESGLVEKASIGRFKKHFGIESHG